MHTSSSYFLYTDYKNVDNRKHKYGFCYLPAQPGSCKGYFVRFYYNSTLNNCQQFIYGGCQGNANRFKTRDECHNTCLGE
ncbi:PREDICTED: kunitz-type serine protease inhibitor Vur-KIn-like [Thamnophis sirtalis]|uniref:Kunitz-type serine protease inhibitor Vur-KIn-like n=1 Tax=Thamnophis sirtalis TaxID=35019 RepID=A0A6I9Y3I7_9SAUR|nr:PREDICTED: kunitz-type serine protease inhibitor Vur-KIn-like [Thamnophis sirtalis]